MKNKDINDFIDWLGLMYLDFQNEPKQYIDATKKEIKEKIKSYTKKR